MKKKERFQIFGARSQPRQAGSIQLAYHPRKRTNSKVWNDESRISDKSQYCSPRHVEPHLLPSGLELRLERERRLYCHQRCAYIYCIYLDRSSNLIPISTSTISLSYVPLPLPDSHSDNDNDNDSDTSFIFERTPGNLYPLSIRRLPSRLLSPNALSIEPSNVHISQFFPVVPRGPHLLLPLLQNRCHLPASPLV